MPGVKLAQQRVVGSKKNRYACCRPYGDPVLVNNASQALLRKLTAAGSGCRSRKEHMAGPAGVEFDFKLAPAELHSVAVRIAGRPRLNSRGQRNGEKTFLPGEIARQQPPAPVGQGTEHGQAAGGPDSTAQELTLSKPA